MGRSKLETPFGSAGIRWDESQEILNVRMEVPAGAAGRFYAPMGWRVAGSVEVTALESGVHQIELSRVRFGK